MVYAAKLNNPIIEAIKALYGVTTSIDDYVTHLLSSMKKSANRTIEQAGRVLEAAKVGFGLGFVTPVAIIAAGQMILGHPFLAAATIATSPVNPVAMTCAAVGAIYFGWNALSDDEKGGIVEKLREGLELGAELIKAMISFVITTAKELLSSEALTEFKRFISDAAYTFGNTLADVTRSIKDRASEAYDYVADKLKKDEFESKPLPRLPL